MEEKFPVNSGNVPPPSQSTNLLSHQLNYAPNMNNGLRRKTKETLKTAPKLKLERILGLTSTCSNILDTANDLIAYAAGAVVVIYNHKRNKQIALLYPPAVTQSSNTNGNTNLNNMSNMNGQPSSAPMMITPLGGTTNNLLNNDLVSSTQNNPNDEKKATSAGNRAKPISCLAFSPDGNYLAAGEMGHQPRILIWDVKEKKLLREFRSHKFGVLALSFSPNMRYLVSVGFQHDGYLYVWDWKKGTKLAGNKVTSRVNAVSFAKDGSYFVTAGLRHVKFWYLDARGRIPKKGNLASRETQVLDGRSGILGVLRDANFVDVACDRNSNINHTYFITDTGILCIFKEGRVIEKWVDLQVKNAYSIAVSSNYVICTCSEGVIRLFEPGTLKYMGILPKPHPLGTDITLITSPDMIRSADSTFYPDAVAMVYDENAYRVTCVYSDRSFYVWDIRDLKKIGKYRSFIFHSDCVWGIEPCPNVEKEDNAIPPNSFATFSGDGTIRIWNLDNPIHTTLSTSTSPLSPPPQPQQPQQQFGNAIMSPSSSTAVGLNRRNIYSRELVKMLYVDPDAAEFAKLRSDFEFNEDQCPDFGIRSLKMSPDSQMMASGDRNGNLRVHDMNTWEMLTYQEAHDSEILSIDLATSADKEAPSLIATASRDRLLHIFDVKSKFQLVQSLDDHSSSITSVKFSKDASRLISCGADKGIIFRNRTHPVTPFHDSTPRPFSTYHNYSGRSTVFDMALDVSGRYIATVTGERKLYVLSVESGKPFRICKPETSDEIGKSSENSGGSLINIDLDPFSGTYAVTSGSDRCIRLFDLTNSSCIEKVCAHSELITSVKFIRTNVEENGLRVISTCSDGTVFVWKVGQEIVAKMTARASDRDLKMRQRAVEEDNLGDLDERKAFALGLQQNNKRLRRVSTVTSIRPTASISQMIRQGERKTFSTMSPAEQKYDDLYKKIAASSNRRNNGDNNQLQVQTQSNDNSTSPGPSSPNNNNNRTSRPSLVRKEPRIINGPAQDTPNNGRKSPYERIAKLDRLYNGLPTNGGRERTMSQAMPPVGMASARNPLQQQQALALTGNSNTLLNSGRVNPVLRRAMSRDALRKEHELKKSPTSLTSAAKQLQRDPSTLNRKNSQPTFMNNRRVSDPQVEAGMHDNDSHTSVSKSPKAFVVEGENDVVMLSENSNFSIEEGSDNDADIETVRDEEDEEEEDEDEDEEEEEEIIFTPEQDKIIKPFEVSMHLAPSTCDDEEEDGRITPVSDNDANIIKADEEEDGSSEENVDDAINRDIVAREPPRVSISISRTTSSVANSNRRRSGLVDNNRHSMDMMITPSSPPDIQDESIPELPMSPNNPAFKEIQKKLEKATKRQSLTARFLSSLGNTKSVIDGNELQKPLLDQIITSFQESQPKQQKTSKAHVPDEKLVIDTTPVGAVEKNVVPLKSNMFKEIPKEKEAPLTDKKELEEKELTTEKEESLPNKKELEEKELAKRISQ
ncbi:uncharacterized protein B0P05DRAFT_642271 [Gilbertella persicaria]|uniref:uncharacterized protein n=1 Tax=Gilbertella persicaria TaxID=101096 RepID=UPI00221F66A4|nr:uncharacterized protein B0P05DRAFT_642271 [Gilbertella persicaria]KAI8047511.1 hypothetical protein B0P05DRAFT_642271 [Gilbertella persicaria]